MKHKKSAFEYQLTRYSLFASVPLLVLLLWVMIYAELSIYLTLLIALLGVILVVIVNLKIYQKSAYQFRSLSNLLEAMIQGDYTLRATSGGQEGALQELVVSINSLANRLSSQRTESIESQLLLKTVIQNIDVAIIAIDNESQLIFSNPAAEKLIDDKSKASMSALLAQIADRKTLVTGESLVAELSLGHTTGKYHIHVDSFRLDGEPQKILFITDVRDILRQEERNAWQSLVRVISHEINNSLAPIASISQTLSKLSQQLQIDNDSRSDLISGLGIIEQRARSLTHFIDSYRKLAKLPAPQMVATSLQEMLQKIIGLFEENLILIESSQDRVIAIDPVQMEQVFINLLKNACEAQSQSKSNQQIKISWREAASRLAIEILDNGVGLRNQENLFVPFYTTKKQGTGVGLLLCRQIIEAHGGSLILENREDNSGCRVKISLPI